MNINFDIDEVLECDENGIAVLDAAKLNPQGAYRHTTFYM